MVGFIGRTSYILITPMLEKKSPSVVHRQVVRPLPRKVMGMRGIYGVGLDVIDIERMERALARHARLEVRLFTAEESRYCRSRARPPRHFAARFAAKEAALKALGTGLRGVRWVEVEVSRDELGQPKVALSGAAARLAAERGVGQLHASLSLSREQAVAVVVAERA